MGASVTPSCAEDMAPAIARSILPPVSRCFLKAIVLSLKALELKLWNSFLNKSNTDISFDILRVYQYFHFSAKNNEKSFDIGVQVCYTVQVLVRSLTPFRG